MVEIAKCLRKQNGTIAQPNQEDHQQHHHQEYGVTQTPFLAHGLRQTVCQATGFFTVQLQEERVEERACLLVCGDVDRGFNAAHTKRWVERVAALLLAAQRINDGCGSARGSFGSRSLRRLLLRRLLQRVHLALLFRRQRKLR